MATQTQQTRPNSGTLQLNECPVCGMEQDDWSNDGEGYTVDGETYCCRGCAEGTGCTCK